MYRPRRRRIFSLTPRLPAGRQRNFCLRGETTKHLQTARMFHWLRKMFKRRRPAQVSLSPQKRAQYLDAIDRLNVVLVDLVTLYHTQENSNQTSATQDDFGGRSLGSLSIYFVRRKAPVRGTLGLGCPPVSTYQLVLGGDSSGQGKVAMARHSRGGRPMRKWRWRGIGLLHHGMA